MTKDPVYDWAVAQMRPTDHPNRLVILYHTERLRRMHEKQDQARD